MTSVSSTTHMPVEVEVDRRHLTGVAFAIAGALGALWAWRVLRQTYFFQDEWAMIRRGVLLTPFESATRPFNGHLWLFQDAFYRIQSRGFGLDTNRFTVAVFLVSLVTLHLVLASFARRLDVPLVPALLFGGLLTYLGPAAQNYVFAVQISPTLATASAIGAATLTVGAVGAVPTQRRATLVAAMILVSVLLDSGVGLLSLAFAGGIVVQSWPRRRWWVLAPTVAMLAIWLSYAGTGPRSPASIADTASFAIELAARSAGALVGGGPWVGVAVLIALVAAIVAHVRAGEMIGPDRAVTVAGAVAAVVLVGAIAQSRAGITVFSFYENNRYFQNVAIPLALMVLPSLVGLAKRLDSGTVGAAALSLGFVVAFLSGQNEARGYEALFLERNATVRNGVVDTLSIVSSGCPDGGPPSADAELFGPLSPGLRVSLVAELDQRELLTPVPPGSLDGALVAAICPP